MKRRICLHLTGLALVSAGAQAVPICRWVNASGQTQIAQVVPEQYKKAATCADSQQHELSPERRQAAETQAAEDRAKARQAATLARGKRASGAQVAASAAGSASQAATKLPTEVITDATDCPTRWRIYDESVACFGPFRTTRGATKVEGFDHCNVIDSPEIQCGPRRH